jgi:hypothetical protein
MAAVTLVLTRLPVDEFILEVDHNHWINRDDVDNLDAPARAGLYQTPAGKPRKRLSGRWGTLALIVGPRVTQARIIGGVCGIPAIAPMIDVPLTVIQQASAAVGALLEGNRPQMVSFAGRMLQLTTDGRPIDAYKEFTTIERYRGDFGGLGREGYVEMPPREQPYPLRVEIGNSVVRTLRKNHDGSCIRVLGGATAAQRGILIHEAPNVGWLIGCISPRPKGDRKVYDNRDGNASQQSMKEIISVMNRVAAGQGSLFVLGN